MKNLIFLKKLCLFMFILLCCQTATGMEKNEDKGEMKSGNRNLVEPNEMVLKQLATFCNQSREFKKDVQSSESRISYIKNGTCFALFVVPYSTVYIIDKHLSDYLPIKNFIYASLSPMLLVYFISKAVHMFDQANRITSKIYEKIAISTHFFDELQEFYSDINTSKKSNEELNTFIKGNLNDIMVNNTTMGSFLKKIAITLRAESMKDINYISILNSIIYIIKSNRDIVTTESLLDLNGFNLISTKYIDLKKLKQEVIEHLSLSYSKDAKFELH